MTVAESEILSYLARSVRTYSARVLEGVEAQDDCAVLLPDAEMEICVTTDFVRGTGFYLFREKYLNLYDVGWYVVAANLSDICAMGAKPICYLSIVRYMNTRTKQEITEILDGISAACSEFGTALVGGDTGTYEADVLAGTAIGYVKKGTRLSRHTLRAGDAMFVSGDLGRPAAALSAVVNKTSVLDFHQENTAVLERLLERWRRPMPRIALAQALSSSGLVTSCMDVSDGLTASLLQLRKITGHGFSIVGDSIPIDWSVQQIAGALNKDPIDIACGASVDFELLFTAAEEVQARIVSLGESIGIEISRIGTVRDDDRLEFTTNAAGNFDQLPGLPWDHQYGDIREMFKR